MLSALLPLLLFLLPLPSPPRWPQTSKEEAVNLRPQCFFTFFQRWQSEETHLSLHPPSCLRPSSSSSSSACGAPPARCLLHGPPSSSVSSLNVSDWLLINGHIDLLICALMNCSVIILPCSSCHSSGWIKLFTFLYFWEAETDDLIIDHRCFNKMSVWW